MASQLDIIDRHHQLYDWSCPAAAVELVLKLHGRIGGGYRKLQDAYNKKSVGFAPFKDQMIRGAFFYERSWTSPFVNLDAALQTELRGGRFPIMGLLSGVRRRPDGKLVGIIHEWVVVGRDTNGDLVAVSKNRRKTTWTLVSTGLANLPHTNVLFYRF